MIASTPLHRLPANLARRALPALRRHARALGLPVGLLLATEGLIQTLWLGQPPGRVLQEALVTLPALVLLVVAVRNLRWLPLRVLAAGLLFGVNYAQYAFFSFYGRFLGTNELRLAAANPTHELLASIVAYFSGPACLAALATTAAYAFPLFGRNAAEGSPRRAAASLLALLGWCLVVDTALPGRPIHSPALALAATNVSLRLERVREQGTPRPARRAASTPPGHAADFDVLYLVGESLRADRFRPGAYARNVAPYLRSLKLPHVAFTNVVSHGDCTGRSVPLLMVEPSQPAYPDIFRRPTLFSYAKQSGYHTAFVNGNENDWAEFVDENIDALHRNVEVAGSERWTFNSDADMLPVISAIANAPERQFLVVETYTGHWPYSDRYETCPECRVYRPDLAGEAAPFSQAYRAKITNSYDNAILYFDRFVARMIGALKKPTLVVITSDHGESLGEGNMWGHCSAAIEQMLVPFMLIATDENVARAVGFKELAAKADLPVSHANIFPTLLKIFGYDLNRLDFPYATDLGSLTATGETARKVLVSEIGAGAQAESFGIVDARRGLARWESIPPPTE